MKSNFIVTKVLLDVVFLIDNDIGMSVTNDAENVVKCVLSEWPKRRIFYRDTDHRWDELVHRNGKFSYFAPIHSEDICKYKEFLT